MTGSSDSRTLILAAARAAFVAGQGVRRPCRLAPLAWPEREYRRLVGVVEFLFGDPVAPVVRGRLMPRSLWGLPMP